MTGRTARSEPAIETLAQICERELAGRFALVIVLALERWGEAERGSILVTPAMATGMRPTQGRQAATRGGRKAVRRALSPY